MLNNATEVFVTWLPPEQPNGEILLYEVELDDHVHEVMKTSQLFFISLIKSNLNLASNIILQHKPIVCIPQKMYYLRKGYVIKGLTPGNWSYKIRTTSRAGVGSWTRDFYVVVPPKGFFLFVDDRCVRIATKGSE